MITNARICADLCLGSASGKDVTRAVTQTVDSIANTKQTILNPMSTPAELRRERLYPDRFNDPAAYKGHLDRYVSAAHRSNSYPSKPPPIIYANPQYSPSQKTLEELVQSPAVQSDMTLKASDEYALRPQDIVKGARAPSVTRSSKSCPTDSTEVHEDKPMGRTIGVLKQKSVDTDEQDASRNPNLPLRALLRAQEDSRVGSWVPYNSSSALPFSKGTKANCQPLGPRKRRAQGEDIDFVSSKILKIEDTETDSNLNMRDIPLDPSSVTDRPRSSTESPNRNYLKTMARDLFQALERPKEPRPVALSRHQVSKLDKIQHDFRESLKSVRLTREVMSECWEHDDRLKAPSNKKIMESFNESINATESALLKALTMWGTVRKMVV